MLLIAYDASAYTIGMCGRIMQVVSPVVNTELININLIVT
jgi:hypothetical protein